MNDKIEFYKITKSPIKKNKSDIAQIKIDTSKAWIYISDVNLCPEPNSYTGASYQNDELKTANEIVLVWKNGTCCQYIPIQGTYAVSVVPATSSDYMVIMYVTWAKSTGEIKANCPTFGQSQQDDAMRTINLIYYR